MEREKQIEEITKILDLNCEGIPDTVCQENSCSSCKARQIIGTGYRKQSVGEWVDTGDFELDNIYSGWKCSLCGHIFCGNKTNYCSGCGAKMGGGE